MTISLSYSDANPPWTYSGISLASVLPNVPASFKRIDPSRQIRAVISTGGVYDADGTLRINPAEGDISGYLNSRAIIWRHDKNTLIAWCAEIIPCVDRIEGGAQFPVRGISALADEIFDQIAASDFKDASIGFSIVKASVSGSDAREWFLREWSFCYSPADKGDRVISVGGRSLEVAWNDPKNPRIPSLAEAGPTQAHYAAALRKYEELRRPA